MRIYKTTKQVLKITPFGEKLLNGLTANSLDKPQNAFLNIHGRIIATFDQVRLNADDFLLVVEKDFVAAVKEHLDRYLKLNKSSLETKAFNVYFNLDADYSAEAGEYKVSQKQGELVLTEKSLGVSVTEEEFLAFRLQYQIPVLGIDYRDEFLLNISETDFVSFTKGCFLGQEPVAKVHHRSRPTWKLTVKREEDCSEEEKQKMTSRLAGTGFVFVKN